MMSTSSELRTPEMTERLVEAFGVHPFNFYATTEGLWGVECERHEGIHLFEDVALLENVDAEGRPVPEGEPGAKVLVTFLYKPVRPHARPDAGDRGSQRRRDRAPGPEERRRGGGASHRVRDPDTR